MNVQIVSRDNPFLKEPLVICGLPGAAFVGKFAVDHLVGELPAKPLAEIYSNGLPAQVVVKEDGSASLMRNDLYYWNNPNGTDLILLTADAQPSTGELEYILSERVIDYCITQYNAKELITLGAFVTGTYSDSPRVYAAGTDLAYSKKIEKLGCTLMREGGITGMNGLLLGMAKLKGIPGYALLGETAGYGFDGKASGVVLECLGNLTGVRVDPEKLKQRAKDAQEVLEAINRESGQENPRGPRDRERKKPNYIS
jgi:uncharacterized protein